MSATTLGAEHLPAAPATERYVVDLPPMTHSLLAQVAQRYDRDLAWAIRRAAAVLVESEAEQERRYKCGVAPAKRTPRKK